MGITAEQLADLGHMAAAGLVTCWRSPECRAALRVWADELHATLDDLRKWSGAERPKRHL